MTSWPARRGALPPHGALDPQRTLERIPTLRPDGLRGALTYWDCQTDDARLTLEVIKTAAFAGALVANSVDVLEPRTLDRRVIGVRLRDRLTNDEYAVDARAVVNATGVWLDELRLKADFRARPVVRPTKGVHLVVPRDRIRNSCAMLLPSPEDRRFIFVLPWADWDIIGTTDTDHLEPRDAALARPPDLEYLLRLVRLHLPGAGMTAGDVRTTFAGLRPLIGDPSDTRRTASAVSREHAIEQSPPGLWSIAGGKLTTFRHMAIDLVEQMLRAWRSEGGAPETGPSRTDSVMLGHHPLGRPAGDWQAEAVTALARATGQEALGRLLVEHYGPSAAAIAECAEGLDDPWGPIAEGLPLCRAEVRYHLRHEMALGVADVLSRRTRWCVFAPDLACAAAPAVAEILKAEFGWGSADLMNALSALEAEVARHAVPPTTGLPNLPPSMENVT
ncbi:MAG: FAD-dependent oxidoreductase [Planctomycetes bacterium]|nr:FAD-dependent oxidoreductase [Planctomycetota bacterium]